MKQIVLVHALKKSTIFIFFDISSDILIASINTMFASSITDNKELEI